jgi:group I intron endonuclease
MKLVRESIENADVVNKLYHYVYLTTNNITGQQYVGDRSTFIEPEKDRYLGSGREIRIAKLKYGRRNFTKKVLEICDTRKEAGDKQGYYIRLYKTHISQGGYNVCWDGGTCNGDRTHSEESKQLMRDKAKFRKPQSKDTKEKRNKALLGHDVSSETIEKIIKKQKGVSKKDIFIKRYGEIEGNKKYKEWIENMRISKLNMSQYTKDKISANTILAMQRPKIKEKLYIVGKRKIPWNKGLKINK